MFKMAFEMQQIVISASYIKSCKKRFLF